MLIGDPFGVSHMSGYESVRDSATKKRTSRILFLDAAQLVKHAFALRTEVHGLTRPTLRIEAHPAIRLCRTGVLVGNQPSCR